MFQRTNDILSCHANIRYCHVFVLFVQINNLFPKAQIWWSCCWWHCGSSQYHPSKVDLVNWKSDGLFYLCLWPLRDYASTKTSLLRPMPAIKIFVQFYSFLFLHMLFGVGKLSSVWARYKFWYVSCLPKYRWIVSWGRQIVSEFDPALAVYL